MNPADSGPSCRRVIARSVPLAWQRRLFEALVHRMPVAEPDFAVALRDHWLAYVAKVVMALYALAFLAPPRLKAALRADRAGNLVYRKTARNFGPVMATAATTVVAEVRELVDIGGLDPEAVVTPGIFVDRVVVVA